MDAFSIVRESISVVIPAFQAERFIGEAISSVLAQEPRPLEVIVVDDGSTDSTAQIARSFGTAVSVISQRNGGEAAARNAGLHAASGAWIAYLDADDRFLASRLADIAAYIAAHPTVDLVTADAYITAGDVVVGRAYGPHWRFAETNQREEILRRNFILGHPVVRRAPLLALGGFDETISHCTDWEMWIRFVHDGGEVGFVDRPLSLYRAHTGSLSADRVAMANGRLSALATADGLDLTASERRALDEQLRIEQVTLARDRLTASLASGSRSVRQDAWAVVRHPAMPLRSRVRGALAASVPAVPAWREVRRRGGFAGGTMGLFVPDGDGAPSGEPARPLVSIVLPFLDEAEYLRGAVDTVEAQTFAEWELILVDDGSTDGSSEIADDAAASDPRIRVVRHPRGENRGLIASRNLGMAEAKAGLLASLDADDRWVPGKLQRQVDIMALHRGVALTCGPTRWVHADGRPDEVVPVLDDAPRLLPRGEFARLLAMEQVGPPPPSNVMYRIETLRAVGGVPNGPMFYEDQRTFFEVTMVAPAYVDDEVLSTYAIRSDSMYGSTEGDEVARLSEHRAFVRWALRRSARSGMVGLRVIASILTRSLRRRVRAAYRALRWRAQRMPRIARRGGVGRR